MPDAEGVNRLWHLLDNSSLDKGATPSRGTLLCVHGNPTWSYLWRRFLGEAAPGWRVVAVDQLGMGFSERTEGARDLATRIDDLDRLTEALGMDGPVVLAAHDWGGPISIGWALRHRDQLAGLVLANTGIAAPDGSRPLPLIRAARAVQETVCVRTPAFVRAATALSRPALPREVRDAFAAPYGTVGRRRAVGDFVADVPFDPEHPSRQVLDQIADGLRSLADVPALLLWGARDPVFTEGFLRDLSRRLPHADIQRYPQASHLVTEDAPQAAEHAWRWIGDLDTPRPARTEPEPTSSALGTALTARRDDHSTAVAELHAGEVQQTTWAQLSDGVSRLAAGLRRLGVGPGDRVALLVPPGVDLTTAVYACWEVGAAIVVADAGLGLRPMAAALRSAAPSYVIGIGPALTVAASLGVPGARVLAGSLPAAARRLLGVVASLDELATRGDQTAVAELAGSGEAAVLFTSGATGPAKGVVYSQPRLRAQLEGVRTVLGITPEDRLVAAFAPFALYAPALGVPAAVPDMDVTKPATLTATALAEAAAAVGGTVVFASPAALRNVAATADALSAPLRQALRGVRRVLSAGAPVPLPLLRQVQRLVPGAELHTPYGMTEALPVTDVSLTQIEEAGPGDGVCVGWPLPGVLVRISALDAAGRAVGELTDRAGLTGEICVAAAHVKDRYDKLWATERESSRNAGWHRTGDVGHVDEAGRLWVEGRLVHVITTANGPVTPVGVEQRIESLPEVAAAALVGVGPAGTQQPVAVVVPTTTARSPLAPAQLTAAVRHAAGVPVAAVLQVDALPVDIRHGSKVDRTRLARWASRVLSGRRAGRP